MLISKGVGSTSNHQRIIEPEAVEEKREELRKETSKIFNQAFPPIILGMAERRMKRRRELQKKI